MRAEGRAGGRGPGAGGPGPGGVTGYCACCLHVYVCLTRSLRALSLSLSRSLTRGELLVRSQHHIPHAHPALLTHIHVPPSLPSLPLPRCGASEVHALLAEVCNIIIIIITIIIIVIIINIITIIINIIIIIIPNPADYPQVCGVGVRQVLGRRGGWYSIHSHGY